MQTYKVLRRHDGDKEYHEGDTRSLSKSEAAHLIELGVLEEAEGKEEVKAEEPVQNKAEPEPENKAVVASTTRRKKG